MAKPTTNRWTKLSIWVGDGGSPEDFTSQVCGMTAKTFTINGATSDAEVPDCDTPDDPVWIERVMRSLSGAVSGSGIQANETFDFWKNWMLSGLPKNVRIVVDKASPGYFAVSMLLTKFELQGSLDNGKIQTSVDLASDGPITWVAGAP